MSFSGKIKEELELAEGADRHCRLAEIAAILAVCGKVVFENQRVHDIDFMTENLHAARKSFTLLKKTFNIDDVGKIAAEDLAAALKVEQTMQESVGSFQIGSRLVQNTCCKRAFIRGAFLAGGSVSDPEKAYHYEVVYTDKTRAVQLMNMIRFFSIDAKMIARKKYHVVYVKEGSQISDLLNIMGAHVALMEFENIRILKEMRNSINRQVNCETANINKTVQAASKQIDDIVYIRDTVGYDALEKGLWEIARLRVEYPTATLKELGEMMSVPLGKSGVNHRLKRLSCIAEDLRVKLGGNKNDFKEG